MRLVNRVIASILRPGHYLTACYIAVNRPAGKMTLVNMGHTPVLYLPADGEAILLKYRGPALGMIADHYYQSLEMPVKPGDRFLMYSDGLVERAKEGEMWVQGAQRLLGYAPQLQGGPISALPARIASICLGTAEKFDDDMVIMAVEV
jgi:sigma-B regulation protein RsbU (phosphoserine phosphatase)